MNTTQSTVLMGIIPLIIFVIVDSVAGLKWGLVFAILLAIVEAIFSVYYFHEIDSVTLFSLISVIGMAFISYKTQSPIFFKMQPVILGFFFGTTLLISYFIDKPLLLIMMTKYKDYFPGPFSNNLQLPSFRLFLKTSTLTVGFSIYIHAFAVAYAAKKLNNWWWLTIRGVGVYFFLFLGLIVSKFLLNT